MAQRPSRTGWLSAVVTMTMTLTGATALARDTQSSARPPPLEGRTGCELWVGKVSGNDPSVLIEALLCEGMDGAVSGQLQWSSLESGYSIRDIAGRREGDKLHLHDTKMPVAKPNPGWVFCAVDSYELTRSGDQLNGTYLSKKCNDRATVALTKKGAPTPAQSASPDRDPVADMDPAPQSEPMRDAKPETSSCACRTSPNEASSREAAAAFLACALVSFARRARSRAATRRGLS